MKMINKTKKLIFCTATILMLACANANAEDLVQIYKLAQTNDPQFKSAKAILESAYESVKVSRGEFLPKLNVNAGISDVDSEFTSDSPAITPSTSSDGTTTSYSVSLKQPLYRSNNNSSCNPIF